MKTLKESAPTPGFVYKIESQKFGVATVLCVKVPHRERQFPMQFAPLDEGGICGQTLYWDSVCEDQVLETWPNVRAYLRSIDGPEPESWAADARGFTPVASAEDQPALPLPLEPAVPEPVAPVLAALTILPPARPLPSGCKCDPKNWPPAPFRIPVPCDSYTEEDGKCVMCEHLCECHSAAAQVAN